jgi:hypothetical protein
MTIISVEVLQAEIKQIQAKYEVLEKYNSELLFEIERSKRANLPTLIKLHSTIEETIIDQQIARLQEASNVRLLDGNEAKMLDIYIKNKRMLDSAKKKEDEPIDVTHSVEELSRLAEGK